VGRKARRRSGTCPIGGGFSFERFLSGLSNDGFREGLSRRDTTGQANGIKEAVMKGISKAISRGAVGGTVLIGALVLASAVPAASELGRAGFLLQRGLSAHGSEQFVRATGKRAPGLPKLDSRLAAIARGQSFAARRGLERRDVSYAGAGRVRVVVETRRPTAVRSYVASVGGRVEGSFRNLVQVAVRPSALEALARQQAVDLVRPPLRPIEDAIQGEEGAASLANAWHAKGFTGKGVKVAIIDGGFQGLAERQAEGDLPASVVTMDFCGGKLGTATEHGTAVAEIVHDMAPDAQLYLLCIDTEVDLANAESYAKSQGVKVINHSMGWWGDWRSDGSGPVGAVVADAKANGILWVNAAGNEAVNHWAGPYHPSGGTFQEFGPGDLGNSFIWPNDSTICGFLKWDEWPAAVSDFDLYLGLSGPNIALAWSDGYQTGSQPPTEGLCVHQSTGSDLHVFWAIDGYRVSSSPTLELLSWSPPLEYSVAAGSIADPASSPSAFAVGALCWQSRQLEYYSSQGPTIDGRMKPDIAGHDSVSGATYGSFTSCPSAFAGTSAASPEVAGAAALVEQAYPSYGPDQLEQYLQKYARDIGPAGPDNMTGAGELQLPAPPDLVAPTARALVVRGRIGKGVQLLSKVYDDSGKVSVVEQVKRNGRVIATIKTRGFVSTSKERTVSSSWRAPANASGAFQHCVRSTDRAGNKSAISCAKVLLK
jgi:subtilisin family serine protease